jgi:hypothetical protein
MLQEDPPKDDILEEASGKTGRHHWNEEPRLKAGATSGKQDNTSQGLREDCRPGDHKANSWDFHLTAENE